MDLNAAIVQVPLTHAQIAQLVAALSADARRLDDASSAYAFAGDALAKHEARLLARRQRSLLAVLLRASAAAPAPEPERPEDDDAPDPRDAWRQDVDAELGW